MLSAGLAGREGVEELSRQVVALLSGQEPPRKVFPQGLAFDLQARVGEGQGGWSGPEQRVAAELGLLYDRPASQYALGLVLLPLFAGLAASLHLVFEEGEEVDVARATDLLGQGRLLRLGDPLPGPRRVAGKASATVGRLRADPSGQGLHLWVVGDNLRFAATAQAIGVVTALWKEGRI
jgi:aspartate-semialdehyde dehydrogenase